MTDAPKAYAIDAAEGIEVSLDDSSEDETFSIQVRKEGEVVESHAGVTADTVTDLSSEHFTASYVDVPTAPADRDEDE